MEMGKRTVLTLDPVPELLSFNLNGHLEDLGE